QAEDGIRDFHVTGVQTCALPICGFGIQYNLSHCKPSNNIRNSNEATQAPVSPATPRFANSSASSLPGSPACPFTQCQLTWWRAVSLSSSCHRSAFLTGFLADVFQPLRFQPASHSVIPFRTYWESVFSSSCLAPFKALSPCIAAISSTRLLVVCFSPPCRVFSTPPYRITTPHPPGPGLPLHAPSVYITT